MKDIQQLIKKNSQEGRYEDIFPKTFIDAVEDRESGNNLTEILSGFNMYFLSYNGSRELTRLQVPLSLRKTGLWITYVLYDKTVVTEWYAVEAIDDNSWKSSDNWRVGSNMLVGDISISSDGYWVVNEVITTTKAQGEQGITPMLRVGSNNHLQASYTNGSSWVDVSTNPVYTQFRINNNRLEQSVDLGATWIVVSDELAYQFRNSGNKLQVSKDLGVTWEDTSDYIAAWFKFTGTTGSSQTDNVGKIQISRDNGATWSDLSGEFTNSLYIKGYVATVGALPSSAVQGDIYGVGPTYDLSDTEQTNPIYQLYVKDSTGWVNNGKFTSIAAGVVQTTGTSTTEVMSQDAVTTELDSLRSDLSETKSNYDELLYGHMPPYVDLNITLLEGNSYYELPVAIPAGTTIKSVSVKSDGNVYDSVTGKLDNIVESQYIVLSAGVTTAIDVKYIRCHQIGTKSGLANIKSEHEVTDGVFFELEKNSEDIETLSQDLELIGKPTHYDIIGTGSYSPSGTYSNLEIPVNFSTGDKILFEIEIDDKLKYYINARTTLGVAGGVTKIVNNIVASGTYEWVATIDGESFNIIPFEQLQDGSGVFSVTIRKYVQSSGLIGEVEDIKETSEELALENNSIYEILGKQPQKITIGSYSYSPYATYDNKEFLANFSIGDKILFEITKENKFKYYLSARSKAGVSGGASRIVNNIVASGTYEWVATIDGESFFIVPSEQLEDGTEVFSVTAKRYIDSTGIVKEVEFINEQLAAIDFPKQEMAQFAILGADKIQAKLDNLLSGEGISLPQFPLTNNKGDKYQFSCNIDTFDSIRIERGYNVTYTNWLTIDNVNITLFRKNLSDIIIPHGLNISRQLYINVTIENGSAFIQIKTIGGYFSHEFTQWGFEVSGLLRVVSIGSTLSNAVLCATNIDFKKPIWWFGASYESINMVSGAMRTLGYFDYYLNAKPGRNTSDLKADFYRALQFGRPKILITSFANTSDVNIYMSDVTEVYNKCLELGIVFIIKIQPSSIVSFGLEDRNELVIALGSRVIDTVNALRDYNKPLVEGADCWYDGYLGSDGQHPTQSGSMAIAMQTLSDVPELMQLAKSNINPLYFL